MSSTEVQSKIRSPGIIAKLMGLDGLRPQQKGLSEDAQMKNPSRKKDEIKSTVSNGLSRRSTKEQQEFKDVFEVSEASFTKSFSCERIQKSNLTGEKMMLIRQKFADAKRLSTNKKLQDSDIYSDRPEVLYCKRDRLHSLQKKDSLSARHMYGNEANMKATSKRYNSHDFCCAPERRNPQPWRYNSSPQRHCFCGSTYFNSNHAGRRSFQMEEEEDLSNMATKIVILKPNLGNEQNAANIVSPPRSSHVFGSGFRTQAEFQRMTNRMTDTLQKKSFPPANRFSRHNLKASQEIAKEVNTLMRSYSNFPSSRIYYYAESGSSSDESANETEIEFLQSRNSFQSNNQQRASGSSCKESFVSREAKKRMSERWKLTNISQAKGVVRRSSTLAEMLAIPAKEFVPANLNSRIRENQFQNRLLNNDGLAGWNEPLGISSRDGTKVVSYERSYKSRSSPASMVGFGKSKIRKVPKIFFSDKYVTPEEAMKLEGNKAIDLHLNRDKKDLFSLCQPKEIEGISSELHYISNQANSDSLSNRPSDPNYTVLESPSVRKGENIKNNSISEPYESLPEILADKTEKCNSRSIVPNTSVVEQFFMSFKEQTDVRQSVDISVSSPDHQERLQSPRKQETDQESPVSILEPPFKDDFSSCSDCFSSLSADLHGLRMQLQLLKLESEGCAGEPVLISSDGDGSGEESLPYYDEKDWLGENESWEFSYICEVLSDSGLDYSDPNELKKTCFSPEFPVNALIFEELEKKHEGCTTQSRSERKLLFDWINGGIVEIFQPFVKPFKGKTLTAQLCPKWTKEGLERNLYKLLISSQEIKGEEDSAEKVVERESEWLNLGDDIEVIGVEIGRILIDELVATELVCFCS